MKISHINKGHVLPLYTSEIFTRGTIHPLNKRIVNTLLVSLTLVILFVWSYYRSSTDYLAVVSSIKLEPTEKLNGFTNKKITLEHHTKDLPLRDRLSLDFPYDTKSKIPPKIWQTWKEPVSEISNPSLRHKVDSWASEVDNGFEYQLLTDQGLEDFVHEQYSQYPEIIQTWEKLPLDILRFDFARYLILFVKGGIYSDVDTLKLSSLSTWIDNFNQSDQSIYNIEGSEIGLMVGVEGDFDNKEWHYKLARRVQLVQWTLKAKSGHPVLLSIILKIVDQTLNKYDARLGHVEIKGKYFRLGDLYTVLDWTGPALFTDTVFSYLNEIVSTSKDTNTIPIINPNPKPKIKITHFETSFHQDPNDRILNPNLQIGWQNFTQICQTVRIDDVLILPLWGFNSMRKLDDLLEDEWRCDLEMNRNIGYVAHDFQGSWKVDGR